MTWPADQYQVSPKSQTRIRYVLEVERLPSPHAGYGCAAMAWDVREIVKLATARSRRGRVRRAPLSFADDARRAGALTRRLPRTVTVDVAQVVGSVGRSHELGLDFRPSTRNERIDDSERYSRVRTAMRHDRPLPPVELYKLGCAYYVLDGHHRVAAALDLGQLAIDASVTEHVPGTASGSS